MGQWAIQVDACDPVSTLASILHTFHCINKTAYTDRATPVELYSGVDVRRPTLVSLSTIVLNSRDWSEIVWLPKISHLKSTLQ